MLAVRGHHRGFHDEGTVQRVSVGLILHHREINDEINMLRVFEMLLDFVLERSRESFYVLEFTLHVILCNDLGELTNLVCKITSYLLFLEDS